MTMDIVKAGAAEEDEQIIKPQATAPAVDTSEWPLLLKNYERRTSPCETSRPGASWSLSLVGEGGSLGKNAVGS